MKIFTMQNTSITLLIASILMAVLAFGGFSNHDAKAQETKDTPAAVGPAQGSATIRATVAPQGAPVPVETVIVPIQQGGGVSPEKVENLVLKWIMVLTSILTAISSLIVFVWSKVAEVKKTIAANTTQTEARLDRQDRRVETTREKAEALEVKVEKHLTTCDPLKNPGAHGGSPLPSSPPQPPPPPPAT